jgi:hypothetical protein
MVVSSSLTSAVLVSCIILCLVRVDSTNTLDLTVMLELRSALDYNPLILNWNETDDPCGGPSA